MLSHHLNKYVQILERHRDGICVLPESRAYEYAWALELRLLHYTDIPPSFIQHVNVKTDFGTDLISLDGSTAAQVKHYTQKRIDYTDLAKFVCHAEKILGCTQLVLLTTQSSKLTKQALELFKASSMMLARHSLHDLLKMAAMRSAPYCEATSLRLLIDGDVIRPTKRSKSASDAPAAALASPEARPDPAPTAFSPRRGQLELVELFRTHQSEGPFRAQLPCGYGKTAALGMLLKELIDSKSAAAQKFRAVVFVPWLDLLKQTVKSLQVQMPFLSLAMLWGDTPCLPEDEFDVLVATHASIGKVSEADQQWSLCAVDEAHHLRPGTKRRSLVDKLRVDKHLELSATFHPGTKLDLHVSLRDAIHEGNVADYKLQIVKVSSGSRVKCAAKLFRDNYVAWGATLTTFNKLKRCRRFVKELEQMELRAAVISGKTPLEDRNRLVVMLGRGELHAIVCDGCLNEGSDIPFLMTVFLADERGSLINLMQLSQRPGRLHPLKAFARVVLAVHEIQNASSLLRSFFKEDPVLCEAVRKAQQGLAQHRVTVQIQQEDDAAEDEEEAEVLEVAIWSSLGQLLEHDIGPDNAQKAAWLVEHFPDTKPGYLQVVEVVFGEMLVLFHAGRFVHRTLWNFTGQQRPKGAGYKQLDAAVVLLVQQGCKWLSFDPIQLQVDLVVQHCSTKAPMAPLKVEYVDSATGTKHSFRLGKFFQHRIGLLEDPPRETAGFRLTEAQRAQWHALPWMAKYLQVRLQRRRAPTPAEKLQWLLEHCPDLKQPVCGQVIVVRHHGGDYPFQPYRFWNDICGNFSGGQRKLNTLMTEAQQRQLEAGCAWVKLAVEKKLQALKARAEAAEAAAAAE